MLCFSYYIYNQMFSSCVGSVDSWMFSAIVVFFFSYSFCFVFLPLVFLYKTFHSIIVSVFWVDLCTGDVDIKIL
jgi:hypothetical protein